MTDIDQTLAPSQAHAEPSSSLEAVTALSSVTLPVAATAARAANAADRSAATDSAATNSAATNSTAAESAATNSAVTNSEAPSADTDSAFAEDGAPVNEKYGQRLKSFVIRAGRMTNAQKRALAELGPRYMITIDENKVLSWPEIFGSDKPVIVEIGFGMGKSLVEMAGHDPEHNYVGIEVHPPGVGACLLEIEEKHLTNLKVIQYDAFVVLSKCLQAESLDALQIFFPDPWHKKRHHKRRLINDEFLALVTPLLKHGGAIRLATDWENYAEQMLDCLNRAPELTNLNPAGGYIPRPDWRPLTKFEARGERLGHGVWDLVFTRVWSLSRLTKIFTSRGHSLLCLSALWLWVPMR